MSNNFNKHIGVRVEQSGAGSSRCLLPVQPCHDNSVGVVHGGALFTLADTSMGAALHSTLERGEFCATIEIKMTYFKAVREGTVVCETVTLHRGKSVASMESTLSVEGVLVAKASGSFAILRHKKPGAEPA